MIKAMTTDLFLDFLAIRMDAERADGLAFKINFITPDNNEKFVVEMSNAALTNIKGYTAKDADLTITINRADLETVMMGKTTFDDQIKKGVAKLTGNRAVYEQLKATLVHFELGFEMIPGTRKAKAKGPDKNPFEQQPPVATGE
jgi:alkyl sulfatase BDS1-like metallo-beta-lactamase superfamily hydrolase